MGGVNKMVLIRQTSELVWIIFHYTAHSGDYFPQCLSQKSTIFMTSTDQVTVQVPLQYPPSL